MLKGFTAIVQVYCGDVGRTSPEPSRSLTTEYGSTRNLDIGEKDLRIVDFESPVIPFGNGGAKPYPSIFAEFDSVLSRNRSCVRSTVRCGNGRVKPVPFNFCGIRRCPLPQSFRSTVRCGNGRAKPYPSNSAKFDGIVLAGAFPRSTTCCENGRAKLHP